MMMPRKNATIHSSPLFVGIHYCTPVSTTHILYLKDCITRLLCPFYKFVLAFKRNASDSLISSPALCIYNVSHLVETLVEYFFNGLGFQKELIYSIC
jgi:hypothetical protein